MTNEMVTETEARLMAHEEVCAERYKEIGQKIARLEAVILTTAGVLICSMAGMLVTLLMRQASR